MRKDVPLAVTVQVAKQSASDTGVTVPVRSLASSKHESTSRRVCCRGHHSLHNREESRVLILVVAVILIVILLELSEDRRASSRLQRVRTVAQPSHRRIQDHAPVLTRRVVRVLDRRDQRVGLGDAAQRDEDITTARRQRVRESCGSLGPGKGRDQTGCGRKGEVSFIRSW